MSAGYLKKCSSGGRPKKSHPTQADAEGQRWSLVAAGMWKASTSNTYFCNQCGGWHAGEMGRGNRGKGRQIAKKTPRHLDTQ